MAKHWGAFNRTHGGSIFWNKSRLLLTGDVFISFYLWQPGWRRIFINIALVPPPLPNISSRRSHSTERLPWLWSFPILHLILIFLVHFLWWHFSPQFGFLSQIFPLLYFGNSTFSPLCLSSLTWGSIFLAWVKTGWTSIIRRRKEGRGLRPLEAGIRLLQTLAARLSSNCPSHNLARHFFSNYPYLNLDSF